MEKKRCHPLFWLLLIPCQLAANIFFVWLGSRLDLYLLTDPKAYGHGIPFFSTLFLLIASAMTLIICIFSIVMTILAFRRRYKTENK